MKMIFNFRADAVAGTPKLAALPDLPDGHSAFVARVDEGRTELLELGFVQGARVKPTHSGLGGDPRVYELDGSLVALRAASARHVYVVLPEDNAEERA